MTTTSVDCAEWDHLAIRLAEAISRHDLQTIATLTSNLSEEEGVVLIFTFARMLASFIKATSPQLTRAQRYEQLFELYPPA